MVGMGVFNCLRFNRLERGMAGCGGGRYRWKCPGGRVLCPWRSGRCLTINLQRPFLLTPNPELPTLHGFSQRPQRRRNGHISNIIHCQLSIIHSSLSRSSLLNSSTPRLLNFFELLTPNFQPVLPRASCPAHQGVTAKRLLHLSTPPLLHSSTPLLLHSFMQIPCTVGR